MKKMFLHYPASLRQRSTALHKTLPRYKLQSERDESKAVELVKEKVLYTSLKQERRSRGWSQADVAEKIGCDPKTVSRWERGLVLPSLYLSQKLSELFQKSAEELKLSGGRG